MYEYFEHCIHAARLYILKETDDTIPAARRHMKVYVSFILIEINPDICRMEFTRILPFYLFDLMRMRLFQALWSLVPPLLFRWFHLFFLSLSLTLLFSFFSDSLFVPFVACTA